MVPALLLGVLPELMAHDIECWLLSLPVLTQEFPREHWEDYDKIVGTNTLRQPQHSFPLRSSKGPPLPVTLFPLGPQPPKHVTTS